MKLPNKAFDIEYSTQYRKEYLFLLSHNIQPTFVKHTRDFNIPVYKYKKTPELFAALSVFYEQERNSNIYSSMLSAMNSSEVKFDGYYGDTIDFSNMPDVSEDVKKEILSLTGGH